MAYIIIKTIPGRIVRTSRNTYSLIKDAEEELLEMVNSGETDCRVIDDDWFNVLTDPDVELTNKPSMFKNLK